MAHLINEGNFLLVARRRAFLAFCVVGGGISTLSGIKFFIEEYENQRYYAAYTMISPLFYLIAPVLNWRGIKLVHIQNIMIGYSFIFAFITIYLGGGLLTHAPFMLIAVTMISSMMLPSASAIFFTVVSIITLFSAHIWGLNNNNEMTVFLDKVNYNSLSAWMLIGFLLIVFLCIAPTIFFMKEMKNATIKLQEAIRLGEHANNAKTEFLARMSHELRTPMNAILGVTQLMEKNVNNNNEIIYFDIINKSGINLLNLIDNILDYSQMTFGKMNVNYCKFDLKNSINEVIILLMNSAVEKNIEIKCNIDHRVENLIYSDKIKLQQILINLIGNSIKFTEFGLVSLDVLPLKKPDGIEFLVRDTGIGISEEKKELIFNMFTQADTTTTRAYDGAGLGLSITKGLVELLGGEIELKSEVGVGTEVRVFLPVNNHLN